MYAHVVKKRAAPWVTRRKLDVGCTIFKARGCVTTEAQCVGGLLEMFKRERAKES